jgi:hypothetical protein
MNYFISKTESDFIPLPDRIVANGSYCARVLSESGFGRRVAEGGGLRQTYLQPVLYGAPRAAANKTAAHVLVTPSIGRYRAIELIHKSVEAFRATPDLKVIVKCHPSMSIAQLRSFFPSLEIPPNMTFTAEPLSDLFPKANVLVYNDGTFPAAEALAFGLPVVFVEAEYGLSLDSLDGFPEIRPIARTPGDIAKTVLGLLGHSDNENEVRARLGIVRQLVGQVTERIFGLFAE